VTVKTEHKMKMELAIPAQLEMKIELTENKELTTTIKDIFGENNRL